MLQWYLLYINEMFVHHVFSSAQGTIWVIHANPVLKKE